METNVTNPTVEVEQRYSKLYTISIQGKEIGRIESDGAVAHLCILARNLAASGHGHPLVECVDDGLGRKPFGFWYCPTDREIIDWKTAGHHVDTDLEAARAAIRKATGGSL